MDEEIIQKAKAFSRQSGKSLSEIVADYFKHLDQPKDWDEIELGPITKSLMGSLKGANVNEEDYYRYLEENHRYIFKKGEQPRSPFLGMTAYKSI